MKSVVFISFIFDPAKEILGIQQCLISILMKKGLFSEKYNGSFSPILQRFQFEPEQKNTCNKEEEVKNVKALVNNLSHIFRNRNLDLCKY